MSNSYKVMEDALLRLDEAVSNLARQSDKVRSKMENMKTGTKDEPELFAPIGGAPSNAAAMATKSSQGELDISKIERKLDATITQIEDLLNDDMMAG